MGSLYYTDAASLLRAEGIEVVECDGWKTRARSSGGFASAPLGIQWHHTASSTSPENDTAWQTEGSDDAPIGNGTIMRDGSVWLVAAGASNTAGKGGPITFSRGTAPLDSGNSTTWAWEVANNGTGEAWPQVQIDTYFLASIVMNKRFGNKPDDIMTHTGWCEPSCPGRKIDPARAEAVQGPWKPRSINSSGTWNQDDVRAELRKRAGQGTPPPTEPPPTSGDTYTVVSGDSWWGISQKLNVPMDDLIAANPPATSSTVIHPGDKLKVPGSSLPPPNDWPATGAAATTPPGEPNLKRGVKHSNVTWLQAVLCSMKDSNGKPIYNPEWVDIDHVGAGPETAQLFGDASHNAVAYWQGKNGLTADGVYGPKTASKMADVRGK
jgi:LysM repeat protein